MKKILLMLVVLFAMSANIFADGLTATLQQGDTMTPYYGVNAFQEAYAAAQDGAIITLSSGKFNDVSNISKQITVIGAYAFDANSPETTFLGTLNVAANNVKIEGIYVTGSAILGGSSSFQTHNCTLRKCWIKTTLKSSNKHYNTLIDQCVVNEESAMANSNNYCIKNSTIHHFYGKNTENNIAYISNCVIYTMYRSTGGNTYTLFLPYAIYKNNIIRYRDTNSTVNGFFNGESPREYYNNVILGYTDLNFHNGCVNEGNKIGDMSILDYGKCQYPAHPIDAPLGSDGTVVGPYGGTGFSEYPAIPRIISKSIDSNSNAEGKINVKITVKAEQ